MKPYRNDKHGFELKVPEEWAVLKSGTGKTTLPETIAFKCEYFETFEIQISALSLEPSAEQIANEFRNFAQKYNVSSLNIGRMIVERKEHAWARYYQGGGKWIKKYQIILGGRQYTITAHCFYQNMLLEREKVWDAVVASFHRITTAAAMNEEIKEPAKEEASLPRLVTYRNHQHGFEIDVPEEWPQPKGLYADSVKFDHSPLETLNIIVGFLLPERLLEYTEFEFSSYAQRQGHTHLEMGRITSGGKKHAWARYQMATGVWAKKYMIVFGGIEYAFTASCMSQQILAERERIWDAVVQSFRLSEWRDQDVATLDARRAEAAGEIFQKAYTAAAEGRYDEACSLLEQCLRDDPDHILAHKELAFILKNLGQVSAAVPHRLAVKRLAPEDRINRFNLAGLYTMLGAKDEALREMDELKTLELNNNVSAAQSIYSGIPTLIDLDEAFSSLNSRSGEPSKNLEQAIELFQRTLEVLTRQNNPEEWATAQNGLGEAYRRLSSIRNKTENLDQAIVHYHQALEVTTPALNAGLWAAIHNNLGIAYATGASGDRAENIEKAIDHCQQALQVYTRDQFPDDWAMTQNNLGSAYRVRVVGDRVANVQQAIALLEQALIIQEKQANGEQRAGTHYNLVRAYVDILYKNEAAYNEKIIFHGQRALEYYSRETYPMDWAALHLALGWAYQIRTVGNPAENLKRNIYHLQQVLTVMDAQTNLHAWGSAQSGLAYAFARRSQGNAVDDLNQAIFHFKQVIKVFSQTEYPEERAKAQEGLAMVEYMCDSAMNKKKPLSYPQFYLQESIAQAGEKCRLKLILSEVPDFPYDTHLVLIYQWEERLPEEEANKLGLRTIAYLSCAIYEAARHAGLGCQPSPIPHGRRPAWLLEGERSPISLTVSDIDSDDRRCQLTIGGVLIALGKPPSDRARWEKLNAGFKALFGEIRV